MDSKRTHDGGRPAEGGETVRASVWRLEVARRGEDAEPSTMVRRTEATMAVEGEGIEEKGG